MNDHLRYKLLKFRVQKTINFFHGPTQLSRECVAKFVRNRGWPDHAKIVDNTMLAWKPSNCDVRRSTRPTVPEVIETDLGRGVSMYFASWHQLLWTPRKYNSTSVTKSSPSSQFVKNNVRDWFCRTRSGHNCLNQRIENSLWIPHRHQALLRERSNTQYVLECGNFVIDATAETCKCHPGR